MAQYHSPVPEHQKTPEARLWLVKELVARIEALTTVEREERPLMAEEKQERNHLCARLRGFRALAKMQISNETDQAKSRWVKVLSAWDGKNKTVGTVSSWNLQNVDPPKALAQDLVIPAEIDGETVTQKALTPAYNRSLYRESQRRFGKLKHPVLELLALGYNKVDGVQVPPQARVNALKEAAKYFEPQLKQIEMRQAPVEGRSGVLAVPGRMNQENWSNMVEEHLAVLSKATKKLHEVAGGRAPATFEGEIEEAEVVEAKESVDGVRRDVGVQDDSGVSRASSQRVVESEGTGGGETPVELPPTVVRMPVRPAGADVEDHTTDDVAGPQWEVPPPQITKPPKDFSVKGRKTPPRRPRYGRKRVIRDPDSE